ncbi:hypothetical protein OQA88_5359 [Cercophora sp. LCS_1]
MEVAGLALGAVGVIGLVSLFKDTADLFNLVADSRHLGRDFEILDTKLDIEKTLLLHWAEGVKLLDRSYDARLDDETTRMLVARALSCIASLLTNESELKERYGLSEVPERFGQPSAGAPARISHVRWDRFLVAYSRWQTESAARRNAAIGRTKRMRWVIRDRDKFERLVQEVGHFASKIREIVPVPARSAWVAQDVEAATGLRQLKILRDASLPEDTPILQDASVPTDPSEQPAIEFAEAAERAIVKKCEDRILAKLWFRRIDDRRESIAVAHQKTLDWVLRPEGENIPWDDLSRWLRTSSGMYWVVGKAGSGKSTLMKYLFLDHRTKEYLEQWAAGKPYQFCSYFFANLGTMEQKSLQGLARTFLHQILSVHPGLIPRVLPHMWRQLHDGGSSSEEEIDLPSPAETRRAFEVLANDASLGRFCFLIDGLDEFVGYCNDGIDFIRNVASHPRVKIIVSSRPIPDCVAAFSRLPQLRLQDLNRGDIETYVNDVIGTHEYTQKLIARQPEDARAVIGDVIEKSSAYDRIAELRRRVDELPPELNDMFHHMLNKTDTRHRKEGMRLLRTCYAFHDAPWENRARDLYSLGLALVEDYNTDFRPIQSPSAAERHDLCEELCGRLRSRCGGLLEFDSGTDACVCVCSIPGQHDQVVDSRVVFMHRTVFEFLRDKVGDPEAFEFGEDDTYDVCTALSLYMLHMFNLSKHIKDSQRRRLGPDPHLHFRNGLHWSVLADAQPLGAPELFFDNAPTQFLSYEPSDESIYSWFARKCLRVSRCNRHKLDSSYISLLLASHMGAVAYVRKRVQLYNPVEHGEHECSCPPLLAAIVDKNLLEPSLDLCDRSQQTNMVSLPRYQLRARKILELLLEAGCDPNKKSRFWHTPLIPGEYEEFFGDPWSEFLGSTGIYNPLFETAPAQTRLLVLEMMEMFLKAGADTERLWDDLVSPIGIKLLTDKNTMVASKARCIQNLILELQQHPATTTGAERTVGEENMVPEDTPTVHSTNNGDRDVGEATTLITELKRGNDATLQDTGSGNPEKTTTQATASTRPIPAPNTRRIKIKRLLRSVGFKRPLS